MVLYSVLSLSLDFLSVSVVLLTRATFFTLCYLCVLSLGTCKVVGTSASDRLERLVS